MSTAQVKPTPAVKSEAVVEQHLARARRRIRVLDLVSAGLGLVILTFAFVLVLVLCDRWLMLSPFTRQMAFGGYLLAALVLLTIAGARLVLRRINPYYAALKVEQTIPNAKNSVVNWLDLRDESLPPAIRGAVTNRAARDLAEADLDSAISARRGVWLGGIAAGLFLALLIQFFLGGNEFMSRFWRVFAPFGGTSARTRTELVLTKPEGGNVTVPLGHPVQFEVEVRGQVPNPRKADAVRLLYRYHQTDPYEEQKLERAAGGSRTFVTMVPAFQVHNGFWYKIAGGDTETAEYHVSVRSTPLLSSFDVTYRYRPYLRSPDSRTTDPNLEAMRGTEVTLIARANRNVREGTLEFIDELQPVPAGKTVRAVPNGKGGTLTADKVQGEPQAMQFQFILDRDGKYRIWFVADNDERNTDPLTYNIKIQRDAAPTVELKKPGQQISLPTNGVLPLEGAASDDLGITGMTLKMRLSKDEPLPDKPYRADKKDGFRLADGSYPKNLDYKDFVELDKLKGLKPGLELEYWLEATDACDYPPPGPNVGRSEVYKIKLTEPQDQKQKENQAKRAQQDQQKHEKKQDQDIKEQSQRAQDQASPKSPEQRQNEEIEQQLRREAQRKKREGEPKPDKHDTTKGDPKGEGKKEPGDDKGDKNDKGEGKPEPKDGAGKQEAGQSKNEGKPGDDQKKNEGSEKGPGQQQNAKSDGNQKQEQKGECKECKGGQAGGAGQGKDEGKKGPEQQKNEGGSKAAGKENGGNSPQESKGEGKRQPQGEQAGKPKGDGKGEGEKGGAGQGQEVGGAKPDHPSPPKGDGKDGGQPNGAATESTGASKNSKQAAGKGGAGAGEPKPTKDKGGPDNEIAKGAGKGEGDTQPAGADEKATKEEIGEQNRKLQNATREGEEAMKQLERLAKEGTPRQRKEAGQALQDAAKPAADQNQKSTDPQVRELADQVRDAKKVREEAQEKLAELARNAESPENRNAAKKALKEAREGADAKEPPNGNPEPKPSQDPGTGQPKKGDPKNEPGAGKPGKGEGNQGEPKQGDPKTDEPGKAKAPGKGANNPGEPGQGSAKNRTDNGSGNSESGGGEGTEADADFQRKAGELQLENWKKLITPEMMKENKWTKEQIEAFFKAKQEALKRQQELARERENPTTPKGASNLRPQGPREVKGTGAGSTPLQGSGPAQPPPPLREGIKKFTEKLPTIEDK